MHLTTVLRDAFGWLRAPVPAASVPLAESPVRRTAIRAVAAIALAVTVAYLAWRISSTIDLSVWWLSLPMIVLEVHAALGLALFTFSLWDVDATTAPMAAGRRKPKVAVLVPTANEGIEILIPTLAAAVAIRGRHQTWVLDDGDRPEVKRLARELKVRYLARSGPVDGKAGNVNNALTVVKADLVAILDADHVADPAFLERTLAYFADPAVALVQTPPAFYNETSFAHAVAGDGERFHEQTLFHRMQQPGRARWDAVCWSGTGAVLRVAALEEIGGIATETVADDVQTSIRLHRRAWRTVYHNEVLSRGLAAADADTYQLQRLRRATGAMQVLRVENPLWVSGLKPAQRVAYAASLVQSLDAWRILGFMLLPMVVLATGVAPVRADALVFAVAFACTYGIQQVAYRALSRGCQRPLMSLVFGLVAMTPNLRATRSLFPGPDPSFPVTPKGRIDEGRKPVRTPIPLQLLLIAGFAACGWFVLTLAGYTPLSIAEPGWAALALAWVAANLIVVSLAVERIGALRYASERRASVRFEADLPVWVGAMPGETLDVSTTGARVVVHRAIPVGDAVSLTFDVDDEVVTVAGTVRAAVADVAGLTVHGIEFAPGQNAARARLALVLFRTREVARIERVEAPASRPVVERAPVPA